MAEGEDKKVIKAEEEKIQVTRSRCQQNRINSNPAERRDLPKRINR